MEKVVIIIPAYNEEKRIESTLKAYSSYFSRIKKNKKLDYELLVVINNTQDKTEEIVRKCAKKYKGIQFLNFKQGGKGFAIIEGFKEALKNKKNKLIGFVDADLATSPEAYYDLISRINNQDGIIASRYVNGAIVHPKQTLQRIVVSRLFNILIRILFLMPYRDTQCGAKLFKREVIQKVIPHLTITQWAFDVDLIYKIRKLGFDIKESPTVWSDKEYSKIDFMKAGPKMALSIIRLRLIDSPLRFIVRIYDLVTGHLAR